MGVMRAAASQMLVMIVSVEVGTLIGQTDNQVYREL
jgi:hypothetical protein